MKKLNTPGDFTMRSTIDSLPYKSSLYDLYDLMAIISHLNPSFHPSPSEGLVHVKVDTDKTDEAKKHLEEWRETALSEVHAEWDLPQRQG